VLLVLPIGVLDLVPLSTKGGHLLEAVSLELPTNHERSSPPVLRLRPIGPLSTIQAVWVVEQSRQEIFVAMSSSYKAGSSVPVQW